MGETSGATGMTTALRRTWIVAGACLASGLVASPLADLGVLLLPEIGLLLLAVAGGTTAGRGDTVGRSWFVLALAVPVLPLALAAGVFVWLAAVEADPLAVVLLVVLGGAAVLAVWAAFVVALVVELVRRRRRRFGEPRPAWKNDPTPPPHS